MGIRCDFMFLDSLPNVFKQLLKVGINFGKLLKLSAKFAES